MMVDSTPRPTAATTPPPISMNQPVTTLITLKVNERVKNIIAARTVRKRVAAEIPSHVASPYRGCNSITKYMNEAALRTARKAL